MVFNNIPRPPPLKLLGRQFGGVTGGSCSFSFDVTSTKGSGAICNSRPRAVSQYRHHDHPPTFLCNVSKRLFFTSSADVGASRTNSILDGIVGDNFKRNSTSIRLASSVVLLQEEDTITTTTMDTNKGEGRHAKRPRSVGDKPRTAIAPNEESKIRSPAVKKGAGAPDKTLQVVKEPIGIGLLSQVSSSTGTAYSIQEDIRIGNQNQSQNKNRGGNHKTFKDNKDHVDSKPGTAAKGNNYMKGLPPKSPAKQAAVKPGPNNTTTTGPSVIDESQGVVEGSRMNMMHSSGVAKKGHERKVFPPPTAMAVVPSMMPTPHSLRIQRELSSVVDHIQIWQREQYNSLLFERSSSIIAGPGPSYNFGTISRPGMSFNYQDSSFGRGPTSEFAARFGEQRTPERVWETTSLGKNVGPSFETTNRLPAEDGIRFTVMSYNVLSPKLAESHAYLYKDVDPEALKWENRLSTFFEEISTLKPDVVCLQEVDGSLYAPVYQEKFKSLGYSGVFKKRTRDKEDGCAIFYSTKKFRLLDKLTVEFFQPHIPLLNRDNVAVLVKLEAKNARSGNKLVVGTTHLLFNPKRHDVKLAQTQLLLAELDRFACCGLDSNLLPIYLPTILTGDFNIEPYSSILKLLTLGNLPHCDQNGHPIKCLKRRGQEEFMPPCLGISDQCQHYQVVNERVALRKKKKSNFFEIHSSESNKLTAVLNSEDPTKKFRSGATNMPNTPSMISARSSMSAFYANPNSTESNISSQNSYLRLAIRPSSLLEFAEGDGGYDVIDRIVTTAAPHVDIEILESVLREGILCTFGSSELSHKFFFKDVYASKLDGNRTPEGIATTKQNGWVCVDYIFYSSIWHDKFRKQIEGKLKLIRRLSLFSRSECKELGNLPRPEVPSDHYPLLAEFMLKN